MLKYVLAFMKIEWPFEFLVLKFLYLMFNLGANLKFIKAIHMNFVSFESVSLCTHFLRPNCDLISSKYAVVLWSHRDEKLPIVSGHVESCLQPTRLRPGPNYCFYHCRLFCLLRHRIFSTSESKLMSNFVGLLLTNVWTLLKCY